MSKLPRKGKMREFVVTLTTTIRISERAIKQGMSREHSEEIVPLTSPARVAEHIAFNMVVNKIGFANLPNGDAVCERATVEEAVEV